jgi:hypothetical protein
MAYTLDSTLGDILADPRLKPLLDQHFPGLADNPQVGMLKGLSLRNIVSNPLAAQFGITQAKAESLLAEVNKVV